VKRRVLCVEYCLCEYLNDKMAGRKILTSALFQRAAIVNARRTYAAGDPVEMKFTLASPGEVCFVLCVFALI
jgi:hypothetical protein